MSERETPADDAPPPPKPRSRLEDEVLEILARADQPVSLSDHVRRKMWRQRRAQARRAASGVANPFQRLGSGTLLLGSLAVAFIANLVRPSSSLVATLLALVSVALLLSLYFVRHRGPGRQNIKTWRGRDIDLSPPQQPLGEWWRERFRRPPRR